MPARYYPLPILKTKKVLSEMAGYPHKDDAFIYAVVQNGMVCGGPKSLPEMLGALPEGAYEQESLMGAIVS